MTSEVPSWEQLRARVNAPGYATAAGLMRWMAEDDDEFYGHQPRRGQCRFVHAAGEKWRVEDDQGLLHIQNGLIAYVRDAEGTLIRSTQSSPDVPDGHPWSLYGNPLMRGDRFTTKTDFYYAAGPARPVEVAGRRGWEVELRPPAHKAHPLLITVDDLTGTVLREVGGGGVWVTELVEFTPHVDIDFRSFEWTGPYTEHPVAGESRRADVDRVWEPTPEDLEHVRRRLDVIEVLLRALEGRRELIDAIAAAHDSAAALAATAELLSVSAESARPVLEMQLRRLPKAEHDKIREEHAELRALLDRGSSA